MEKGVNPKKLLENVFQLILLTLGVLYNIPKVYQDLSTGKVIFQDGVQNVRQNIWIAINQKLFTQI